MTARERTEREVGKAARRAAEAEQELAKLEGEMLDAGISPDLDRREAIVGAAHRLRLLSESLHER